MLILRHGLVLLADHTVINVQSMVQDIVIRVSVALDTCLTLPQTLANCTFVHMDKFITME